MTTSKKSATKSASNFFLLGAIVLLGACSSPKDEALARAEAMMKEFSCSKAVEVGHQRLMAEDLRRAQLFLQQYGDGRHLFNAPIDEVITNQLAMYRTSCPT